MRPLFFCWSVVALLAFGVPGSSLAKPPKEYVPPASPTAAELARAKSLGKSNLPVYPDDTNGGKASFPWLEVLFFALLAAGLAPFAIKAYRKTAAELPEDKPPA